MLFTFAVTLNLCTAATREVVNISESFKLTSLTNLLLPSPSPKGYRYKGINQLENHWHADR